MSLLSLSSRLVQERRGSGSAAFSRHIEQMRRVLPSSLHYSSKEGERG